MPKSIPTSGTLNWSIPLNDHISQLQDPTNGAINSFSQFSGRPTNLTANDIGKTYLYTQTGNIHQWTGTTWKVLNESVVNVKDYGAVGDGVTNDSVAVQGLLDRCTSSSNKSIFFPEGKYLLNVVLPYAVPNIIGQGHYSTALSSFTPTGYVFTLTWNQNWLPFEIRDLALVGYLNSLSLNDPLTVGVSNPITSKGGIQFGRSTYVFPDQISGGLRTINVMFKDLAVGINKRYGNIGNSFEHCYFNNCDIGYKAIGYLYTGSNPNTNSSMNCGCDTFYKCEFEASRSACIFINGNNNGVGANGQFIFRDCIFQYNPGFAICAVNLDNQTQNQFAPGLIVENCWSEGNASSLVPVFIDGVQRERRNFYFDKANVILNNIQLIDIELIKSQVRAKGCETGFGYNLYVIRDNQSCMMLEETTILDDLLHYTKTPQYTKLANPYSLFCTSQPRNSISNSTQNLLISNSYAFSNNIVLAGGTNVTVGIPARDGVLYNRCLEIDINAINNSQPYIIGGESANIPPNKYFFWSVDLKKISGTNIAFGIKATNQLSNNFSADSTNWKTYVGMGDTIGATGSNTVGLWVYSQSVVARFRISCFQLLAFDTLQELMEYSESLQFRTVSTVTLPYYALSVPTTGTYNKGDIVYNTNPASAGYVGWVCTVGGNPATWKGFGLIQ
jgi:Pectate lyase superfamily protein